MSDSFVTTWTVAHQAPLSIGFLRQKYQSGLPFPSPGDPPNLGIKSVSCIGGWILYHWVLGKPQILLFCCSVAKSCLTLWHHGQQHARLPCPSLSPRVCSNSCPLNWWCHPPSHPRLLPTLSVLNLSQHQGLFQCVSSSHHMAEVLQLQLQNQSFQWIFRVYFL